MSIATRSLRTLARLGIVLAILLACGETWAHAFRHKALEIVHPWCYATAAAGPGTVAIYMKIRNGAKETDRLIGADAGAGGRIELREAAGSDGSGKAVSFALPPGKEIVLAPGGRHLLLTGLDRELRPRDMITVTLAFERAGKVAIEVLVEPAPAGHAH
ncbi:MAG: copper chaperone PCu(A)C [Variibacter sp.]|nr:copper chaperone PCu(A)C [Variibacter sp.]